MDNLKDCGLQYNDTRMGNWAEFKAGCKQRTILKNNRCNERNFKNNCFTASGVIEACVIRSCIFSL